jgi:hypothetical protein
MTEDQGGSMALNNVNGPGIRGTSAKYQRSGQQGKDFEVHFGFSKSDVPDVSLPEREKMQIRRIVGINEPDGVVLCGGVGDMSGLME